MSMVALSPHHVSLDQNRGAQRVKNREKEHNRNESSTTTSSTKSIKGVPKVRRRAATTSTTPPAKLGSVTSGTPGPLPSVYGTILSGRY
jgi:hypothetical protein